MLVRIEILEPFVEGMYPNEEFRLFQSLASFKYLNMTTVIPLEPHICSFNYVYNEKVFNFAFCIFIKELRSLV